MAIISELGENYQFSEDLINKHFRVQDTNLNYFTILSLLNYIKRDNKFENIRKKLHYIILKKFDNFAPNNAESTFLLIDILTCPYVASSDNEVRNFRKEILNEINFWDKHTPKTDRKKKFLMSFQNIHHIGFIVGKAMILEKD